jgi:hypothetical protein
VRAGIGAILAILVTVAVQAQIQIGPGPFRGLPPAQPVATGTSSIEGAVTDSLTHNPIRKAMVNLNGRTSLVAATDVDGHFAFHQLPAGQYSLQAQSDQYPMAPFSVDLGRQATVSVAADEHKTGVGLSLVPGASLRGRIVDEEGNPMPQCTVSPIRYRVGDPSPATVGGVNSPTNDKGEYQIESVPAGKYYLMARCFQSIPMPHAFVRRDALAGVPRLTYPPLFYPASADLSGGTRVSLPAGTELTGIDFRMVSATGITVRGRVRPVLTGLTQITLAPKEKLLRPFQQQGARANQTTGEFQIQSVRPGSYEIEATAQAEGRSYSARVPIEVGGSAPDSIDVLLQPAPQISGSVEIEGDPKPPLKNLHVALLQLDTQPFGPPPQAEVQSDGSFVTSASPGRWRLQVNGAPGYVKSVTLGDQEVSAASLEIGAAPGTLKIILSTKYSQVDATVAASPADAQQVYGMLWSPTNGDLQQSMPANPQGSMTFNVPPGRYIACATAVQPFSWLQNRDLKKALEGQCQSVEVPAEGRARVQMPFVPAGEIKQLVDRLEADDNPAH